MTERQSKLLQALIENYTKTVEPVASALLAQKIDVSSATVRNDLATLEEEGYIVQPHTSAGRIPSITGYRFYLDNFLQPKKPVKKEEEVLKKALKSDRPAKEVAKSIAEITQEAVLLAFAENDFYYTGISYLFAQPEFGEQARVIQISQVLDAFEKALKDLYKEAGSEVKVLIGNENPFSPHYSLLITKNNLAGVMGVLGPLRMDYNRNIGLLKHINEVC